MSKLAKIVMALTAALVVTLGLIAGPASAQDYNGGTVATVAPAEVSATDAANVSATDANAATAVSAGGTLPYTGSDSAPILQIGVALVGAGLLITLIVRSRTRSNA
jgi:LPXTG-motif cell wall-anchored protein